MQLKYKILEWEWESYHPYSLDDSFCMDEAANALWSSRYPEDLGTWPHVPPSAGKSCVSTPESGQVWSRAISLSVRWISAKKAPKPALESVKVGSRSTSVIEGIQSQHWTWTWYSSCQSALNTLERLELMIYFDDWKCEFPKHLNVEYWTMFENRVYSCVKSHTRHPS